MRQRTRFIHIFFFLAILSIFAFGPGSVKVSAEVSVEASLSHLSFPVNNAARLTITVTGTRQSADIELPKIDNIRLRNRGTSSQFSMINGSISSSVSYNYIVQAVTPGAYTIPSLQIEVEGKSYSTKPIHFQVTASGQQPTGYSGKSGPTTEEIAFLRISEKTARHYSGEIVPLTIKAYFAQAYRADINSLPVLSGDGVVMAQLDDKPKQTEESVNGRMYHVLTWETSLSGIKVGDHPIHFSLDATLLIPQKRRGLSPFGGSSLFDDSFFEDSAFDSFFGGHQRKPIVSVSPEIIFKVLSLPTDQQPDDFTGAIGHFELGVSATPMAVEIGEPISLTMEISGTGNFDRVEAPVFPESPDWKTYAPTSNFSDQGRSFSGTKVFEQAIVAKNGSATTIPPLSFSYFDPDQQKYITKTSEALAIQLKNGATANQVVPAQPVAKPQQHIADQPAPSANILGLAPIHLEAGSYHKNIVPLFKKGWVAALCSLCLLLLLTLLGLKARQYKLEKHPEIAQNKQKRLLLEHDLKALEQAQATGDGISFLSCGRKAIQNQLGLLWDMEAAAISLADVSSRLNSDSALIGLFRVADEAAYGGSTLSGQELQDYYLALKAELEKLL